MLSFQKLRDFFANSLVLTSKSNPVTLPEATHLGSETIPVDRSSHIKRAKVMTAGFLDVFSINRTLLSLAALCSVVLWEFDELGV